MSDPTSSPFTWFLGLLDAIGSGPIGKNDTVRQCPAHDDAHPSLSVGEGSGGKVLIKCHAGCDWRAVLAAMTLPSGYLYQPPTVDPADYAKAFISLTFPPLSPRSGRSPQTRGYHLDSIHDYGPDHRVLRYRKGTKKEMFWETMRDGSWLPGLFGTKTTQLPLYREQDVRMAIAAGDTVLLVESESSVDALKGCYATTWAGGANSVQTGRLSEVLGGYDRLIVIPDNDPAGLAALATLQEHHLAPHVLLPADGEDARDLYDRVGAEEFNRLLVDVGSTDVEPAVPTCPLCGADCTHEPGWPVYLCQPCREYHPDTFGICACCNGPMVPASPGWLYCHGCRAYLDSAGNFTHTAGIELCDAHTRYLKSRDLSTAS